MAIRAHQESTTTTTWRRSIVEQFAVRKMREEQPFKQLITSYVKMFELLEAAKEEAKQLSSHHQQQQQSKGHHQTSDQVQELEKKLYEAQDELTALHRRKGEHSQLIIELKNTVEQKERDRIILANQLQDTEVHLMGSKSACKTLEFRVLELEGKHQLVKDEYEALQLAFHSLQNKYTALTGEHAELLSRWMKQMAKKAEKINDENEEDRRRREQKLRKDLEEATKDMKLMESDMHSAGDQAAGSLSAVLNRTSSTICVVARLPDKVLYQMDAHEGEVNAFKWGSPDIVATGGGDRKVKIWQITANQAHLKQTLTGSNAAITSIDIESEHILAGSNDFASRVWTLSDGKLRRTLTGHSNKVLAVRFLGVANKVVSGSHDRTLKIWDLNKHACVRTLFAGSSCNDLVTRQGHESSIISGHFDKRIRFWDVRSEPSSSEILLQGKITSLDISPDGHSLLSCARDDALKLLDLRMNQVVRTFCADSFKVGCDWSRALFSPDNQFVVAGGADGSVFIWDATTGKVEKVLRDVHGANVMVAGWSPKGNYFISCDRSKKTLIWSDF